MIIGRLVAHRDLVAQAKLANYKRFRKLTDEWVGLALKLAKEKRKLAA